MPFRPKHITRAGIAPTLSLLATLTVGYAVHAGTWTPISNTAPGGVNTMLLLSDGTVMAEATNDSAQTGWYKLTPDIHGSYVNGTWSSLASMHDTRLFFASDLMPNGDVLVAGGEYGTGGFSAEVYDPVANTWTYTPAAPLGPTYGFHDCISSTLPNGNVLVSPVDPAPSGGTLIYNWSNNTWSTGPNLVRGSSQDEASWSKLADGSILTVDPFGTNSERYIPSLNQWVNDGVVPVSLYDTTLGEEGPAFLLPNGKAFFLGDTGNTALYTPSGNNNPGTWAAGPGIPNGQACPDAPGAVMTNGVVLFATGPAATYNAPTSFYEYNWNTNSFAQVNAPTGTTDNAPVFNTRMLDLPDGTVLYSDGGSRLYEYTPSSGPLASSQPTITNILKNSDGSYNLSGYQLSGTSEGAGYGDDAQMASNYPIIRITDASGNVHFARTTFWSSLSPMQGSNLQSTKFTVSGLPTGNLTLQVVTNGIASNSVSFNTSAIYSYLCPENTAENFSVPADAAYGAAGGYNYKYAVAGNLTFSNAVFGDPAFGIAKSGFYKPFTQCASEGGSFTFTVPVEAAYGANGSYLFNQGVSGTVTFTNTAWGKDPIPNVAKAGYYMPYTYCAAENGSVSFSVPTDVAYGANGHYAFKHAVTGTIAFNNTTFVDPIPGTVKAGYYRPSH